ERGFDPREFTLVAFGGAGPMHACALAAALNIPRVLVPRHPGVLSALGMLTADIVKDFSQSALHEARRLDTALIQTLYEPIWERARREMTAEGVAPGRLALLLSMDLRYVGQSYEIRVTYDNLPDTLTRFHAAHLQRFGHANERLPVEVVTLRVKAVGRTPKPRLQPPARWRPKAVFHQPDIMRDELQAGDEIIGPSVIYQFDATTYVADGWRGEVDETINLILRPV
ncbi:MAG: hydantoinase/oxoprolinase family protein, partial [Chloroflexi bacterium]|nr:hydantoinase/oxoprolinase family protein [Chloroflexota bacterium]